MWHRNSEGILHRGTMTFTNTCKCCFEIFVPNNLVQCPYILIVSRHPHSHNNPPRTKTPETIRQVFCSLLEPLGWRLADATPCRLLLDNTFIHGLRQVLEWIELRDPGLSDLHPSLVNYDHAARLIDCLRYENYPEGTGIEGNTRIYLSYFVSIRFYRCQKPLEKTPNPFARGKIHSLCQNVWIP